MSLPADLAEPLARAADRLGRFGADITWYPQIGSTNDAAIAAAERGAAEGAVVVADAQTAGRGRLGRVWASPPGAGLYVSVVLRPADRVLPLITLAAGVAVADGVQAATGLAAHLKWPNDLFVGGEGDSASRRKVAGILTERGAMAGGAGWVVIGFGINVLPAAYPPDVAARATSLEAELGKPVDRGLVLAECLAALHARCGELEAGRADAVVSAWRARAATTFGRPVEWDAGAGVQRGVVQDIDTAGALVVSTAAGVHRIVSGEVRWM